MGMVHAHRVRAHTRIVREARGQWRVRKLLPEQVNLVEEKNEIHRAKPWAKRGGHVS